MTMQVIEHIELASDAASITFSSISQDYDELLIVASLRSNRSAADVSQFRVWLNEDTSNHTFRSLYGRGSTVSSSSSVLGFASGNSATADTFASTKIHIPQYAELQPTSFSVDSVTENNATTAFQSIAAALYSLSTAITSIEIADFEGTAFRANSSATLFGITAGSDGTTTVS